MDRVDVLAAKPDRRTALRPALTAETEDHKLTSIVNDAARELSAPIALVNLVLEQIQFFKTQYGLPPELAAARGTDRDVSFCQFVVQSGETFEVTDAERDERVPKYLVKQHGIRSYLGMPVMVDNTVIGSLCVIDTQPRKFSDKDRLSLKKLATLVNRRLAYLSERREDRRTNLLQQGTQPSLAKLRDCLTNLRAAVAAGHLDTVEVGPALRLSQYKVSSGSISREAMKHVFAVAQQALSNTHSAFSDIDQGIGDMVDLLAALEHALTNSPPTHLSTIAVSGRELANQNLATVGGVVTPAVVDDPIVSTPRSLSVTLVSTCLSMTAAQMAKQNLSDGLRMDLQDRGSQAEIAIYCNALTNVVYEEIAAELVRHTGWEPTVVIKGEDGAVRILFATAFGGRQTK